MIFAIRQERYLTAQALASRPSGRAECSSTSTCDMEFHVSPYAVIQSEPLPLISACLLYGVPRSIMNLRRS